MSYKLIEINLNETNQNKFLNRIRGNRIKTTCDIKQIERTHCKYFTYHEFFEKFLSQNLPVIIDGICDDWECMNWLNSTSAESAIKTDTINNNRHDNSQWDQQQQEQDQQHRRQNCDINFSYLEKHINGEIRVPIANCRKEYYNSHEKNDLSFQEYLSYWRERINNSNLNAPTGTVDNNGNCVEDKLLYLKDWHLKREMPNYKFYETPTYFASDWLNEYCTEKGIDDYRFVYMGPKDTWTPFHVDVFTSFSWSTNISGTKRWLFLLPGEEQKLKDSLGNFPFNINDKDMLFKTNARFIEVLQYAGETVFVPSGWYHQVWNLSETISINHNWFNSCNISRMWTALHGTYQQVVSEINDCREMDNFDEHCQLMLKSVFGMNFETFLDLLNVIVKNRINVLNGLTVVNGIEIGQCHAQFDLLAISLVLKEFQNKCSITESLQQCSQMLHNLSMYIK